MTESPDVLFERLLEIMARLRGPDGCPWDRAQTRTSLKPFLIEEAYEVLEAIEAEDPAGLREELGDLLFQVVFHARLGEEEGTFTTAELLEGLIEKMVSRHPHVFGQASVGTPGEALAQWEAIKGRQARESGRSRSVVDGVPRALPSLVRAQRIQSKAARVHFDWPDARAAWEKVEEETREAAAALGGADRGRLEEELGDVLFSLVNVARLAEVDAEDALRRAVDKFHRRFTEMEADLATRGLTIEAAGPEEMERAWAAAKAQEARP